MFENNVIGDNLPNISKIPFKKIHKNYFKVILLNLTLVFSIFLGAVIFINYKKLNKVIPNYTYLLYLGLGVFFLLLLGYFYIGFSRRKYALREKDVSYKSGVLIKSLTTVPFNRIQHIEIDEGFFSRAFKLAAVNIFTAGAAGKDLSIKGISRTEALKIKAFITDKINE